MSLFDKKIYNEEQIKHLFRNSSLISGTKILRKSIIKRLEETMMFNLTLIDSVKTDKEKTKKEIAKYKRRIQRYWKKVKNNDYEVMESANDLLEMMKIIETDSVGRTEGSNLKNLLSIKELCPVENMGFSKEDGFSRDPSGKINIMYQTHVFILIKCLLDLVDSATFFLLHQADIFNALEPDPEQRDKIIIDFYSNLFPHELTRSQCLKIIKAVFDSKDVLYSESYIKKQLSNWNVYQSSTKHKKAKPLVGYENAKKTESDFEDWVEKVYFPYYNTRRSNRSVSLKKQEKYDENSKRISRSIHY